MKIIRAQRKRRKVRKIFMNKRIRKWMAAMVMMVCALVGSAVPAFGLGDLDWEETTGVVVRLEETEEEPGTEKEEDNKKNDKDTDDDAEEEAAFSTLGNGELGDAITSGNKDFYTIHTKNNNTFYLVIDHSGSTDNVYMLSMIDENDLSEFMEEAAEAPEESQVVVVPEETQEVEVEPETEPEPEQKAEPEGNASLMTLLVLAAIGVGGALYYFKVYKPKKESDEYESEGMETEDGLETENEDEETE